MTTLSIVGTAGRTPAESALLTLPRWNDMKRCVFRFVKSHGFTSVISGGSAWADHLAVGLFNANHVSSLILALPCHFNWDDARFVSGHEPLNPAKRLNDLHATFSTVIRKDSRQEIKTAIYGNGGVSAEVIQGYGFHARNDIVAERADAMIAFTFNHGAIIGDRGGTAYTAREFLKRGKTALWHVDLHTMELHENGRVE